MSAQLDDLMAKFSNLPETEKFEMASKILAWSIRTDHPPLTDDELARTADAAFLALDERERAHG